MPVTVIVAQEVYVMIAKNRMVRYYFVVFSIIALAFVHANSMISFTPITTVSCSPVVFILDTILLDGYNKFRVPEFVTFICY